MDCIKNNKQGAEILTDYCAGTVNQTIAAEIDAHIQECAECKKMVEAQCAVWEMLDAWTPVEVSGNFDSRLYARIAVEQSGPRWLRWWSRLYRPAAPYGWWKPLASVAVAGAIVSLLVIARLPQQNATAPGAPVAKVVAAPGSAPAVTAPTAGPVVETAAPAAASSQDIDLQQVEQALDDLEILAPAGQAASSPL